MKILDTLKNIFIYEGKYKTHSEAVIIACYFNPQNNPYRLKAFNIFYDSIKHLNHRIVECVIGDSKPQLEETESISRIYTENLLWHKESLLNKIVKDLPQEFKYIFWLDTDVLFTNKNWLVDGVAQLKTANIIQPFEYCVHLEQDELVPSFDTSSEKYKLFDPSIRHPNMWRSFASNHIMGISGDKNYDKHGHVGFAWGARREVLESVPLYDRALIGGADHIIAHAAAGQINHTCITKSFTENLEEIEQWSSKFFRAVKGKISYVKGDLYHIWHGDISKRQYLKRIQDYTPIAKTITKKDANGLHVTENGDDKYVKQYFDHREVKTIEVKKIPTKLRQLKKSPSSLQYNQKRNEYVNLYPDRDDDFIESLLWGYFTDDALMGSVMGGNPVGAMIGEMLNTNDDQQQQDDSVIPQDTTDYTTSENFS